MTCLNGQCLAAGSSTCGTTVCGPGLTCGDPVRSLCCPAGHTACGGSCCGQGMLCNWGSGQCMPYGSDATRQAASEGYIVRPASLGGGGYGPYGAPYGGGWGRR
jgi:hypothetical protein